MGELGTRDQAFVFRVWAKSPNWWGHARV